VTARRSICEWARLLDDRDAWQREALETERCLVATTAQLADALILIAQLDRRTGPRRVSTASWVLRDLRANVGRRHDDTCRLSVCQCGEWDPTARQYVVAP
jgi:hypothetical protein